MMRERRGFTLVELLVVMAVIALSVSILMPALWRVRKKAMAVCCRSRLGQWGFIFSLYTGQNNNYFHQKSSCLKSEMMWYRVYKPYYKDLEMRFCPTANDPNRAPGTFGSWWMGREIHNHIDTVREWAVAVDESYCGSYGINWNITNLLGGFEDTPALWRRADVKGADKVPALLDSMNCGSWDKPSYRPPKYDGEGHSNCGIAGSCINRHMGHINVCFMDFSVRKVGLKELWTLKWSRTFDTCGLWTICGFGGDAKACAEAWDEAAPWMKDFPEY